MRFIEFSRLFFSHSKWVYVLYFDFFLSQSLYVTITTNVLVITVVVRQCYLLYIIIIIVCVSTNNYTKISDIKL